MTVVMEDEQTPTESTLHELQKLVEALEKGGYETNSKLVQGSPLVVESLEPTMKVITFGDPGQYRLWKRRCMRISNFLQLLRLRSWSAMFFEASCFFEEREKYYTIKLDRSRFQSEARSLYHETKSR